MTKHEAMALFGGRLTDLAGALGITVQAVYQWPAELTVRQEHEVLGAFAKRNERASRTPPPPGSGPTH